MRKVWFPAAVAAILFITALNALAGNAVVPSTTLSAETGNNTSTADSFTGWSDGNEAATNVSKVDTRSLLYAGASTKIFAHFMAWFGGSSHLNVGYNSSDPNQVTKQVEDMMSRGIQGAIIDWYGQKGTQEDLTTQQMMQVAEAHSGFMFAVMEDAGAIRGCSSCQGPLISDLTYAYNKYEQSPAYFRINGRPVVFFFDTQTLPGVNLAAARTAVPGNPIFIIKDASGFTMAGADGGYSWVTDTFNNSNWGQNYLDYFYKTGQANPSRLIFGSTKKGFNDTKASWSANRIVPQNCGQTWLNTFSEIGKYYSASGQLENLQLVTWNDYEEGTALEMGIDNCVSIAGSASGSTVSWTVTGAETTLDHYTVYISSDGENLMPVTDVAAGTHQLDLSQFGFPQGAYTVYVKAVGKPSIKNHMSGAIAYTSTGGGGSTPVGGTDSGSGSSGSGSSGGVTAGSSNVTAVPAALTVASGKSGTMTVTLNPSTTFTGNATLACAGLPAGVKCSFANSTLALGSSPVSTTLTISVGNTTTASLAPHSGMFAFWLPGLGLGMVVVGKQRRSRKFWLGLVLLVLIALMVSVGCGGVANSTKSSTNGTTTSAAPGTYPITIQATAGSTQQSTTATLVIN